MTERGKSPTQAVEDALANARALAAGARGPKLTRDHRGQPVYHDRYFGNRNPMAQVANVALPAGGDNEAARRRRPGSHLSGQRCATFDWES
jgi:hypothetical protein